MGHLNFLKVAVIFVCMVASSVHAINVVDVQSPAPINDNQLTNGSRTLSLPAGDWTLIAKHKGTAIDAATTVVKADTLHAYAVDTKDGVFKQAVYLLMPTVNLSASSWVQTPCKEENVLFKDDFNSGFKLPECLMIHKRASHLARPSGDFYPQAAQWMANEKVKLPGAVYEVVYSRYSTNDYGVIRVFIPVKNVSSDEAVIAWAKTLPERLKRFFEKRDNEASIPVIVSNK